MGRAFDFLTKNEMIKTVGSVSRMTFLFVFFLFQGTNLQAAAFPVKIEVQKLNSPSLQTLSLNEFKKATVLFFWASWCTFCKEVVPDLVKLQDSNPKVRFIGISVDESKKDAVAANLKDYKFIRRQFWIGPKFLEQSKIKLIPLIVLINENGEIDTIYEGSKADKIHYLKKRVNLLNPR